MKLQLTFLCGLLTLYSFSQKTIASPRDSVKGEFDGATVKVRYGSPAVKGREIWGRLVPYGQVWRAGANEATTFETDHTLWIKDKELKPGRYSFFAIPTRDRWTFIFNKVPDQWGAFEYDPKMDAARVEVEPQRADSLYERLKFDFRDNVLVLKWEKLAVPLPLKVEN